MSRAARDERGGVAMFTAVVVTLLVVVGAFAVDLGMQRVVRRDMQALADVVALDLARELDGRSRAELLAEVSASNEDGALRRSVARNSASTLGEAPVVTAVLGGWVDEEFDAAVDPPTAVRVSAAGSVGLAFAGGSGAAQRSATAQALGGACFSVGSYAAALDSGSSPVLGPVLAGLGSEVDLTVADHQGLASTHVSLASFLGVDLGAGTMQEVVDADRLLRLGDVYLAVAEAVRKDAGRTAQVALLESVSSGLGAVDVRLSEVLDVGTGGDVAGLDAALNVLDLVTAGALAASGENAVVLPDLSVDLGPLAGVEAAVSVIEPPQVGCGRKGEATARDAQVRIDLDRAGVDVPGLAEVALRGTIDAATTRGLLTDVRCEPDGITVDATTGLLEVDLTLEVSVTLDLGLFDVPLADVPVRITGRSPTPAQAVVVDIAGNGYDVPGRAGSGDSGLPWLVVDTSAFSLLGLPIGTLTDDLVDPLLVGVVDPLVQELDTALLTPVLGMLGTEVSGAEIHALPAPSCGVPRLVE